MAETLRATISMLGTLDVSFGTHTMRPLPTQKARALLAYLIVHRSSPHSRERLIELFWPDSDPEKSRQSLNTALWALRKAIKETGCDPDHYIEAGKLTVRWIGAAEIDVERFEHLASSAQPLELREAIALYRGGFLESDFDEWVIAERERYAALYEDALEALVEHGDEEAAKALLLVNAFSEGAYGLLIDSALRSGRPGAARALFERGHAALRGVGEDVAAGFAQRYESLTHARFERVGNVPSFETSYIGRQAEFIDVATLLDESRLVTITGTGGIGKTRLAAEVGRTRIESFGDGVWFVELAALSLRDDVSAHVAMQLGCVEGTIDSLIARYREKSILLVLDNCEHVVENVAVLAAMLLSEMTELRILSTSRMPLGIAGEHVYRMPPMNQTEALRLLSERAIAYDRSFRLAPHDAYAFAELVRRLDGLPLAIELAAARLRVLSPQQVHAKVEERLEFLHAAEHGRHERHQTLRATLQWSYTLLPPDACSLLRLLGTFVGSFDVALAEALAKEAQSAVDVLDTLRTLLDASLLQSIERNGSRRFALLETVKQFAREELNRERESDKAVRAHARVYAHVMKRFREGQGDDESAWVARVALEMDDVNAAFSWAVGHDALIARHLCVSALLFFYRTGRAREGTKMALGLLACDPEIEPNDRRVVFRELAAFAFALGQPEKMLEYAREAVRSAEACGRGLSGSYGALGVAQIANHDYEGAEKTLLRLLDMDAAKGDRRALVADYANLGALYMSMARYDDADASSHKAVELADPNSLAQAVALENISETAQLRDDYERALQYALLAREVYAGLGNDEEVLGQDFQIASCHAFLGGGHAATAEFKKALQRLTADQTPEIVLLALEAGSAVCLVADRAKEALEAASAAHALRAHKPLMRSAATLAQRAGIVDRIRARLSAKEADRAWESGLHADALALLRRIAGVV